MRKRFLYLGLVSLTCCTVANISPLEVGVSSGPDIHAKVSACDLLTAASLVSGDGSDRGTQSNQGRKVDSSLTHVVGGFKIVMEMSVVRETGVLPLMYGPRVLGSLCQRT